MPVCMVILRGPTAFSLAHWRHCLVASTPAVGAKKLGALSNMAALCRRMLEDAAFRERAYAENLQGGSLLFRLIAQLLPALPTLAAVLQLPAEQRAARYPHLHWTDASHMAALLARNCLRTQLLAHLTIDLSFSSGFSSGAPRLLQTVCQLVVQAPLQLPADMPAGEHEAALCDFSDLASRILSQLTLVVLTQQRGGSWSWGERPQQVAEALLAALPGFISLLRANAASANEVSCSSGCSLYEAVGLLQALARTASAQAGSPFSSQAAAVPWCDAASAALRALPAAIELAKWAGAGAAPQAAFHLKILPHSLLMAAQTIAAGVGNLSTWQLASSPAGSTACLDFPAALFQLHTAACQAAHWMAAREYSWPLQPTPKQALAQSLSATMAAAAQLYAANASQAQPWAATMAAAHWEVQAIVQAVAQAIAGVASDNPFGKPVLELAETVAALARAAALCPAAAALNPAPLAWLDRGIAAGLKQARRSGVGLRAGCSSWKGKESPHPSPQILHKPRIPCHSNAGGQPQQPHCCLDIGSGSSFAAPGRPPTVQRLHGRAAD